MRGADGGLTLIEVLVALALFAIIGTAISGLILGNLRISGQTNAVQQTAAIAQDYMEDVRSEWSDAAKFAAGTLPTAPTGLPSGVTCTPSANPATGAAPLNGTRQVTLSCTGTKGDQKYSLVVTAP